MLWKNTGTAGGRIQNALYRWTGSAWELYFFTAANMQVDNLAAITANLGTVTAGTINGVTINASTVKSGLFIGDGDIRFTNPVTSGENTGGFIDSRLGSGGIASREFRETGTLLGEVAITPSNISVYGTNKNYKQMDTAVDALEAFKLRFKTLSFTTPSTTANAVKVVSDTSLYGNYMVVGWGINYNNGWFQWYNNTLQYIEIMSDGLYVNITASAIVSKPMKVLLYKFA